MRLIKPYYKIETPIDGENRVRILKTIEAAARTCYKSEGVITETSYSDFVRKMVQVKKHESVIEHSSFTIRFIIDRGISHELVRHRLAAFSQESTRYVNYSGDKTGGHCQFIIPLWAELQEGEYQYVTSEGLLVDMNSSEKPVKIENLGACGWLGAMQYAEDSYNGLIDLKWRPEQARSVLPNSTKTEVVMTCNARELRHVFRMRTSPHAHPQIREVMVPLLGEFQQHLPELFEDIICQSTTLVQK